MHSTWLFDAFEASTSLGQGEHSQLWSAGEVIEWVLLSDKLYTGVVHTFLCALLKSTQLLTSNMLLTMFPHQE